MPKSLVPNQFDYSGIYVEGKRNQFRFHKPHLASCMSGMLVPMGDPIPVFPGTKLDLKANLVIRSNTMVVPPLDGIYVDVFAVWVPHRIVWNHMPQFLGENDTTAWTQNLNLVYPPIPVVAMLNSTATFVNMSGIQGDVTLANLTLPTHYGIATDRTVLSTDAIYTKNVSALAFRGYYAIWNHLFRDENYQRPVLYDKGDTGTSGEFGYLVRDYQCGASTMASQIMQAVGQSITYYLPVLMPVNKFHDAFTSLLPQPQFGNSVPLGINATAPIVPSSSVLSSTLLATLPDVGLYNKTTTNISSWTNASNEKLIPSNLVADLSAATAVNINQLRTSVMYQRYLEALARGGRRVPEYYEAIYGVKNTKARYDYPEMISHSRYMLGVSQVVATADSSGSGWTSHLGDTGAFSLTNIKGCFLCEKDFTEFGYLHILYCVRADNRYSQAIPEHFFRETLLDEYNPYFDHIGDVAVPNYLVNLKSTSVGNFGYQEAWWSERTQIGLAVGAVNKTYGSLSYWTIGEDLDPAQVTCTPGYLCFDPGVFNDIFVSAYWTYPQFIFDCLIYGKKVARMSAHSIPGIVGRI